MVKYYPDLKVSPSDQNKYKAFKLDNELMVYLISNPTVEKGAGALEVRVGSLRDPREYQGLAHFLEHMLFIGSEKYPGEGEYMTFIGQNGGNTNAYTAATATNYHFEVADDKLLLALDMFAQFFISPLLKDSSAAKEVNAVNSEAEMYYNNDMWRKYNLNSLLCDPKAELSKYNVGNLDTLGNLRGHLTLESDKVKAAEGGAPVEQKPVDPAVEERKAKLVQALKDFHKKYYSANEMVLTVFTKGDLDKLEEHIINIFSKIENKKVEHQHFKNDIAPFSQAYKNKFVKAVPIAKNKTLEFRFRLKEFSGDIYSKSGDYVSWLIGHESKGSILNLLIQEGLALELSSGFSTTEDYVSSLDCVVKLTEKGATEEGIRQVASAVGSYINMLKKEGVQEWIHDEIKAINNLKYQYQDTSTGLNKCVSLCSNYHKYLEPENVLYNGYERRTFNKELTKEIIDSLTLENVHILYFNHEFDAATFSTDPFYKTKYLVGDVPADIATSFKSGDLSWSKLKDLIHLPEKNTFIPRHFDLKALPAEAKKTPEKVAEDERSTAWHWQDNKFKLPKASASLQIYLEANGFIYSAENNILLQIWTLLFDNEFRSVKYMAEMAAIDSSLSLNTHGVVLSVNCFDESLKPFILKVIEVMKQMEANGFTPEQFLNQRDNLEKAFDKSTKEAPFRYVMAEVSNFVTSNYVSTAEKLEAIKNVTYEHAIAFSKKLFQKVRFEWLIEGNVTKEEATDIATTFNASFFKELNSKVLPKSETGEYRVVKLPENTNHILELNSVVPAEQNSCFWKLFEICNGDKLSAEINFIMNWIRSPYFEDLRTQQQLGYVVAAFNRVYNGVRVVCFLIQSNVKSTHYCVERTHIFLEQMKKELENMPSAKFEEIRSGVLTNLRDPNKRLSEQFNEDWSEIRSHQFKFNRREWVAEKVEKLTQETVVAFFTKYFFTSPATFELHFYAQSAKDSSHKERSERKGLVHYENAQIFKRSLELHTDPNVLI